MTNKGFTSPTHPTIIQGTDKDGRRAAMCAPRSARLGAALPPSMHEHAVLVTLTFHVNIRGQLGEVTRERRITVADIPAIRAWVGAYPEGRRRRGGLSTLLVVEEALSQGLVIPSDQTKALAKLLRDMEIEQGKAPEGTTVHKPRERRLLTLDEKRRVGEKVDAFFEVHNAFENRERNDAAVARVVGQEAIERVVVNVARLLAPYHLEQQASELVFGYAQGEISSLVYGAKREVKPRRTLFAWVCETFHEIERQKRALLPNYPGGSPNDSIESLPQRMSEALRGIPHERSEEALERVESLAYGPLSISCVQGGAPGSGQGGNER